MEYDVFLNDSKTSLAETSSLDTAIEIGNCLVRDGIRSHNEAFKVTGCPYVYNNEDVDVIFSSFVRLNKSRNIAYFKIIHNNSVGMISLSEDLKFKLLVEPTWDSVDIFSQNAYICQNKSSEPVLVTKLKDEKDFIGYTFDEHRTYRIERDIDSLYELDMFLHSSNVLVCAMSVRTRDLSLKKDTQFFSPLEFAKNCMAIRNTYAMLGSKAIEYKDAIALLTILIKQCGCEGMK